MAFARGSKLRGLLLVAGLLALIISRDLQAAEWVRAGLNTNRPIWGIRGGLQFGIWPGGFTRGEGGPRGLIRIGYPTLENGEYDLINFIAIEPTVGTRRGLSELETSQTDRRQGKQFWASDSESAKSGAAELSAGKLSSIGRGVEELSVPLRIERFENGAHARLLLSQRSDAPDELRLVVLAEPDSAAIKSCILTATMGNKARARRLWLSDGPVTSQSLFGGYTGPDFTAHAFFPFASLARDARGDTVVAITTDEAEPSNARDLPSFWQYRGEKVTQYWRKPASTAKPSLRCAVNARFKYWMSQTRIPEGLAFENFELVDEFKDGQEFVFGVTKRTPEDLLKQSTARHRPVEVQDDGL